MTAFISENESALTPLQLAVAGSFGLVEYESDQVDLSPEELKRDGLLFAFLLSEACPYPFVDVARLSFEEGLYKKKSGLIDRLQRMAGIATHEDVAKLLGSCVDLLARNDLKTFVAYVTYLSRVVRLPLSDSGLVQLLLALDSHSATTSGRSAAARALPAAALEWVLSVNPRDGVCKAVAPEDPRVVRVLRLLLVGAMKMDAGAERQDKGTREMCLSAAKSLIVHGGAGGLSVIVHETFISEANLGVLADLLADSECRQILSSEARTRAAISDSLTRRFSKTARGIVLSTLAERPELIDFCRLDDISRRQSWERLPVFASILARQASGLIAESEEALSKVVSEMKEERRAVVEEFTTRMSHLEFENDRLTVQIENLENRLRSAANDSFQLLAEELRAARMDAIRAYIDLMNEAVLARDSSSAVESVVRSHQERLSQFGCRAEGREGEVVRYNRARHDGGSLPEETQCVLLTRVYVVDDGGVETVLVKGLVRPSE